MRELHDGIELLEEERDEGAFVWRNWDKWKDRCEEVISYLDEQILQGRQGPSHSHSDEWKKRGLVCGVEFTVFRQVVRKYRDWLYEQYGGPAGIRQKLVFAHNDVREIYAKNCSYDTNCFRDPIWKSPSTRTKRRIAFTSSSQRTQTTSSHRL